MAVFKMAKTILASLFKRPATLMYPVKIRSFYKNYRGKIDIDINACIFCMLCSKKCPTNAIVVEKDNKKWAIERLKCISCGYCVDVCPKKCLSMDNHYSPSSTGSQYDEFIQEAKVEAKDTSVSNA